MSLRDENPLAWCAIYTDAFTDSQCQNPAKYVIYGPTMFASCRRHLSRAIDSLWPQREVKLEIKR